MKKISKKQGAIEEADNQVAPATSISEDIKTAIKSAEYMIDEVIHRKADISPEEIFINGMHDGSSMGEIQAKVSEAQDKITKSAPKPKVERVTESHIKMNKIYVMVHPYGSMGRSNEDWNKGLVKVHGNVLLPDGTEVRPGATYEVDMTPDIVEMVRRQILLAGF